MNIGKAMTAGLHSTLANDFDRIWWWWNDTHPMPRYSRSDPTRIRRWRFQRAKMRASLAVKFRQTIRH